MEELPPRLATTRDDKLPSLDQMRDDMLGHNQPDVAKEILDRLDVDYANLPALVIEYEDAAKNLPQKVDDKTSHDTCADLVAKMRGSFKHIEATRVTEKEPFLKSERAIDGFFDPLKQRLEALAKILTRRVQVYLDQKANEERQAREAEARKAREEAEWLRREQADRERLAEESRRRDHREQHLKVADEAAGQAATAEAQADEADRAAEAKPADLARTRSDKGTLSTLKAEWTHATEDLDLVPLETLRPYIPVDVIEKAIKSYVRMGGRQLPGVRIYETNKAVIR